MNLGQQHLSARQRIFSRLEPFPAKSAFKKFLDYLMYGVGFVQWIAYVPQAVKLYSGHNAGSLSLETWCAVSVFNGLWALYGAVHHDRPIFISNMFVMAVDLAIVGGILLY